MFSDIGEKIKGMAKFFCWLGIIGCIIGGIIMISQGSEMNRYAYHYGTPGQGLITGGILMIIVGPLLSWLSSLTLYGFGELISRAVSIDEKLDADAKNKTNALLQTIIDASDKQSGRQEQNSAEDVSAFLPEL